MVKGQFPNFEAILAGAKQNPVSVALPSADALAKSLTRVAKCADDRSRAVTFSFNDVLEMNAESCGVGKAHAVSECRTEGLPEGTDNVSILLCSGYLLDFLKIAGDVPVAVTLRDSTSAVSFALENWTYILMPRRI